MAKEEWKYFSEKNHLKQGLNISLNSGLNIWFNL